MNVGVVGMVGRAAGKGTAGTGGPGGGGDGGNGPTLIQLPEVLFSAPAAWGLSGARKSRQLPVALSYVNPSQCHVPPNAVSADMQHSSTEAA